MLWDIFLGQARGCDSVLCPLELNCHPWQDTVKIKCNILWLGTLCMSGWPTFWSWPGRPWWFGLRAKLPRWRCLDTCLGELGLMQFQGWYGLTVACIQTSSSGYLVILPVVHMHWSTNIQHLNSQSKIKYLSSHSRNALYFGHNF